MKTTFLFGFFVSTAGIFSCRSSESRYLDLNTHEYVHLEKDSTTGVMVNAETGKPVQVYVDRNSNDTIYGRTGEVVNGKVYKTEEGNWIVKVDGDEYKSKSDDGAKVKIEGDEYKSKNGNYTIKREGDGDVKIENGTTQVKIDGKTGERKEKKDRNLTDKVKKIID